jgi:hypothetical protein
VYVADSSLFVFFFTFALGSVTRVSLNYVLHCIPELWTISNMIRRKYGREQFVAPFRRNLCHMERAI